MTGVVNESSARIPRADIAVGSSVGCFTPATWKAVRCERLASADE